MKFRKLLMCLLAGIFLAGFANVYTYAAEEDQNVTLNTDTADKTTDKANTSADTNTATVTDSTADSTVDNTAEEADKAKDDTSKDADATKKITEKTTKKITSKAVKKETVKKAVVKKETAKYSKADLRLLSALIYCEAGGEAYNGKLAVGIVVMNRVRASAFPDSVKSVIYQRYQFGPVTNGYLNKALAEYDNGKFTSCNEKACIKAAKEALSGVRDITVSGKTKKFGNYMFFSGRLHGYTYRLGHHQFK